MDKRYQVIANIPVRKGLEEKYGAHVNVATVTDYRVIHLFSCACYRERCGPITSPCGSLPDPRTAHWSDGKAPQNPRTEERRP